MQKLAFASFSFPESKAKKAAKSDAVDYKRAIREAVLCLRTKTDFAIVSSTGSEFVEDIPINPMDNPTPC